MGDELGRVAVWDLAELVAAFTPLDDRTNENLSQAMGVDSTPSSSAVRLAQDQGVGSGPPAVLNPSQGLGVGSGPPAVLAQDLGADSGPRAGLAHDLGVGSGSPVVLPSGPPAVFGQERKHPSASLSRREGAYGDVSRLDGAVVTLVCVWQAHGEELGESEGPAVAVVCIYRYVYVYIYIYKYI